MPSPRAQVQAFVERLTPAPSEADTLVAAGDEASLRKALELEPDHAAATEALARILIDRGDGADALALLARIPQSETGRSLAAEARLIEAGVDVSDTAMGGVEGKLTELLDRVRDDDAARQEYVDLLETMGADDPSHAASTGAPWRHGSTDAPGAAPGPGSLAGTGAWLRCWTSAASATTSPTAPSSWGSSIARPTPSTTAALPSS